MSPLFLILVILSSLTFLFNFCCCSVTVMSDSLQPHGLQHARLPCPSLSPCSNSLFSLKQKPHILLSLSRDCSFLAMQWKSKLSISQVWPALCDQMDYRPYGSSVREILQTRILEWIAISFSRGFPWPRDRTLLSTVLVRLFTDLLTEPGKPLLCRRTIKTSTPTSIKKKKKIDKDSVSRMWENQKNMTVKD